MKNTLYVIALCATLQAAGLGAAAAAGGPDRQFRADQSDVCEKKKWVCVQELGPSPRRPWQLNSCYTDYNRCVER
jgi:hypothetical protein